MDVVALRRPVREDGRWAMEDGAMYDVLYDVRTICDMRYAIYEADSVVARTTDNTHSSTSTQVQAM